MGKIKDTLLIRDDSDSNVKGKIRIDTGDGFMQDSKNSNKTKIKLYLKLEIG